MNAKNKPSHKGVILSTWTICPRMPTKSKSTVDIILLIIGTVQQQASFTTMER